MQSNSLRPAIVDPTHLDQLASQFVAQAQTEPDIAFQPLRMDAALAVNNYTANIEALAPHSALFTGLPGLSWERIQEGLRVGHALLYKDALADRATGESTKVRPLLAEQSHLRGIGLPPLQAHAVAGNIDAKIIDAIRSGRGAFDYAGDLLAIAKVYIDNPHLQQRSPVTDRHLERMQFVGSTLQVLLQPAGAHPPPKGGPGEDAVERDWLWSLLVLLDDQVWKAGALVWGRRVNHHLRALGSRDLPGRPRKTEAPAAPAEEPAAPITQADQAPQPAPSEG